MKAMLKDSNKGKKRVWGNVRGGRVYQGGWLDVKETNLLQKFSESLAEEESGSLGNQ